MFDKLWKIRRDGGGGYSLLQKTENPGKRGVLSEIPSVVGVWIFSGTTHLQFLSFLWASKLTQNEASFVARPSQKGHWSTPHVMSQTALHACL